MTLEEFVKALKYQQGDLSLRFYARQIGVSAAYLSDVFKGRRNPGPKLLNKYGWTAVRTVDVRLVPLKKSGVRK